MYLVCSVLIAAVMLNAAANTTSKLCETIDLAWNCSHSASSPRNCGKCSPCWNLLHHNYGLCPSINSNRTSAINPQPICLDTLILLIALFIGLVTLLPIGLWFLYRAIKRYYDEDTKYIIDGLIITWCLTLFSEYIPLSHSIYFGKIIGIALETSPDEST